MFFFVSEKWLYPSCAGAGAGAAAKVLPDGAGPARGVLGAGGVWVVIWVLGFLVFCCLGFFKLFIFQKKIRKKVSGFLSRFVPSPSSVSSD